MLVRTFSADTADEALERVKETWGDKAKILSTYESPRGRGAEIRAAIDEAEASNSTDIATPIDEDLEARLRQELSAPSLKNQKQRLKEALNAHGIVASLSKKIVDQAESARLKDDILALGSALDGWGLFDPIPNAASSRLLFFGIEAEATLATLEGFDKRERLQPSGSTFEMATLQNWTSHQVVPLATKIKNQKIEPVLVAPMTTRTTVLTQGIEILCAMGGHRIVLTEVGATQKLGTLLTAGCHPRTRLAQVLLSEDHGHRLEVLNPLSLARLLLNWQG